jgi:hypothetical protein
MNKLNIVPNWHGYHEQSMSPYITNSPKCSYLFYVNEGLNIMNQLSFEVMGMYIMYAYYVHKIDIMICVLNHFNHKMMQNSPLDWEIWKTILVELCVNNYAIHDSLVIGVDGIFQSSTKLFNSQKIWSNLKGKVNTCMNLTYILHMDINITCIPRYPNWFIFFPYYNKDTISCSINSNMYHTLCEDWHLITWLLILLVFINMVWHLQHFLVLKFFFFLPSSTFTNEFLQINPSVAIKIHQVQTIAQWYIYTHPHTTCISQPTCIHLFFQYQLIAFT